MLGGGPAVGTQELWDEVCGMAPRLLGEDVAATVVMELNEDRFVVRAQHGLDESGEYRADLPAGVVFDRQTALAACLGEEDMLREIADSFLCETAGLFPQMRAALDQGDLREVGRLGHRLKGTIVYLGAEPARQAALAVEHFERHDGTTRTPRPFRRRATCQLASASCNGKLESCPTLKASGPS